LPFSQHHTHRLVGIGGYLSVFSAKYHTHHYQICILSTTHPINNSNLSPNNWVVKGGIFKEHFLHPLCEAERVDHPPAGGAVVVSKKLVQVGI